MRDIDASQIQRRQHGLITWAEALDAGHTESSVRGFLRNGLWEVVSDGVFRLAGSPRTQAQALLAAVKACGTGAVASHRSAAWLWGLVRCPEVPEVTVAVARAPRRTGIRVHRSTDVERASVSIRDGIPTTNPLRTLVDLGAVAPWWQVENATHVAVSKKLVTYAGLDAEVGRLARRGRGGIATMRVVLERAGSGSSPASVLEARARRLFREADLPEPRFEVVVGPNGEYRCDCLWQEALLIVELKGFGAHGSAAAFEADMQRENAIVEAGGFAILSYGWRQINDHPDRVVSQIRSVYRNRVRLLASASPPALSPDAQPS